MTIVVTNQGEEFFLDSILGSTYVLRLYQNDVTAGLTSAQIEALTVASFTEATFAGYASSSITGGTWTTTQGNPSEGTNTQRTFTRSSTGAAQLIYGYYVTVLGQLTWFENFPAPISVEFINDAIQVTPRLTLDDDKGRARVDQQVFTASGSWSKPVGLKAVRVRLVGGGGSGGGAEATGAGEGAEGGGGGGGGYSEKVVLADDLAASETVTIGAGGTAATAGLGGNAGGTTSFGSHAQGTGGAGGAVGTNAAGTAALGGVGGAGSGGDVNIPGDHGGMGIVSITGLLQFNCYGGGSVLGGSQDLSSTVSHTGTAGQLYGGGSTGAVRGASGAALASTAGAPGVVLVTEYF